MKRLVNLSTVAVLLYSTLAFGKDDGVIEIHPAWNIFHSRFDENANILSYSYFAFFQRHILTILNEKGIHAIPSLYNSSLQCIFDPRTLNELKDVLKKELNPPYNSLGFLPVIHDAKIVYKKKKYKINLDLAIYKSESKSIQDEVFACKLEVEGRLSNPNEKYNDLQEQMDKILDALRGQNWSKMITLCNNYMKSYELSLPFTKAVYPTGQTLHYFGQSELMYYNQKPAEPYLCSSRLHKSNVLILKANENTNKLVFEFDISEEFPEVQYAYLLKPDSKVIQVQQADIHIQQAPDELPNSAFTGKRYLVINLTGLSDRSIACYSIKYCSRASFDTTLFRLQKETKREEFLARDFTMNFSSDTMPWQLRILSPIVHLRNKNRLYYASNNLNVTEENKIDLGKQTDYGTPSLKMFCFYGNTTRLPYQTLEPLVYLQPPVIRISDVNSWDSVLHFLSDTIMAISSRAPSFRIPTELPRTQADTIRYIQKIHQFIADSLQYRHESFFSHKLVPTSPDSVIKSRTGDCKDFSALLISLLSRINVKAYPAVLNSSWPDALFSSIPSYQATNHMAIHIPQYDYWIDPTTVGVPPWVTPEHLVGSQALVLLEDSTSIKTIPPAPDSAYMTYQHYIFSITGKDLTCQYIEVPEYNRSAYIWKYLSQIDTTKLSDLLFPPDATVKRYSITQKAPAISKLENSKIEIRREFIAQNAVTKIANQMAINIPEIPLFDYVNLFSVSDRKYELYFPISLICNIDIEINDSHKATWNDELIGNNTEYMKVNKTGRNSILISFNIKKGLKTMSEYAELKRTFEIYRELLSTPILMK